MCSSDWKPKAVVFDMDGVIFDSESMWYEAFVQVGQAEKFDPCRKFFTSLIGLRSQDTDLKLETFVPAHLTVADFNVKMVQALELLKQPYGGGYRLKEGVTEFIKFLDSSKIPFALATSTRRETAEKNLLVAGLRDYFKYTTCGDEVAEGKPNPEIYLTSAEKLGVAPESILVFEDSRHGVRAAWSAGMKVIHVPDMVPTDEEIESMTLGSLGSWNEIQSCYFSN